MKNSGYYYHYLESFHWRQVRLEKLKSAGYTCEVCRCPATCVHHSTYKNLGHEELCDLAALCEKCHGFIHSVMKKDHRRLFWTGKLDNFILLLKKQSFRGYNRQRKFFSENFDSNGKFREKF